MKKSEQYWNAACALSHLEWPLHYDHMWNMAGASVNDMLLTDMIFFSSEERLYFRAFFFFMVAEEHRIHGE